MIDFSRIPFVRLLIPFISGIIICRIAGLNWNAFYLLTLVFIVLGVTFFLCKKKSNDFLNLFFLITSDLFLFLSAIYSCYLVNPLNYSDYYGYFVTRDKTEWVGEIIELPVEKENFVKAVVQVKSISIAGKDVSKNGKVIAYFKKPVKKSDLFPGNQFRINSSFLPVQAPLNPGEFNYRNFLSDKGIHYQTFVESGRSVDVRNEKTFSIVTYGLLVKSKLINLFNNGNLSKEAAQLCAALLTGYDDEINPETINAFAHSGTLHVLSVSGLHTGILFAVLAFLFGIADRTNRFKKLQLIGLLSILWLFVVVAGFSPPVLRAAVMLSFLAIGKYYYNYLANASLNILAVSAFIILLVQPVLLFDTGFLLSYTAVIGILLVGPVIEKIYVSKNNKLLNKIWQLCCISIAAQISTLPATLLFFHQFPLWFILTNLIVIPLCSIIMLLGILYSMKMVMLSPVINVISSMVLKVILLTDTPGTGYIEKIDFSPADALILTALMILLFLLIKNRSYYYVLTALSLIIIWQVFSIASSFSKKNETACVIYQMNKKSACDYKNAVNLYYSSGISTNDYQYHVMANHTAYNYAELFPLNFDYLKSSKSSLLRITNKQNLLLINFLKPDYIVFSDIQLLQDNFVFTYKPIRIIADGSVKFSTIKKIRKLCEQSEIDFYSTRESGFLKLNL